LFFCICICRINNHQHFFHIFIAVSRLHLCSFFYYCFCLPAHIRINHTNRAEFKGICTFRTGNYICKKGMHHSPETVNIRTGICLAFTILFWRTETYCTDNFRIPCSAFFMDSGNTEINQFYFAHMIYHSITGFQVSIYNRGV